jgi:ABC-type transport system involved in multi-copper enzyme maturation permease subunit
MLERLLLDPLAIKELSGSARRWQTYAGRGLYVAGFVLILWSYADRFSSRHLGLSSSGYAKLGKDLFVSLFALQMVLATLGAVSAASDLVTKEIRAGTLSILTCSPLTPFRIAFGKWKAAFAQGGTLILCGAPVVAFCVYLGGPTAGDLTYSIVISFAATALGAATGLYFSTRFRSGVTALLVSSGALTLYAMLPALIRDYTERSALPDLVSPLTNLVDAARAAASRRPGALEFEWSWISSVIVTAFIVWLLLWRTAARLAQLALVTPGPGILSRIFSALDRFYEDINPERFRGIRLFQGRDGVWESRAVLWKELQTRASGRLRNNVRIALGLLILLASSFVMTDYLTIIPFFVTTLLLWILALSNGASLFVTEKEERKWDILLATPLTSGQILSAKLLAGLVPILPTVVTIILYWSAIFYTHHLHVGVLFLALSLVFMPAALAYTIGALCSLQARSLRGAFLTAFTILLVLMLVLPVVFSYRQSSPEGSAWYSPLSGLFWIADRGLSIWAHDLPDRVMSSNLQFDCVYAGAIVGVLTYLFTNFDRVSGRSA